MPSGPQWAYEITHDGYRFICRREGDRIGAFSRRGHDWTDRVPRIVDTFARLPATSVTLDGEAVACGPDGVTDFDLLRAALGRPAKREVFLYAFDMLELDGRDIRRALVGPTLETCAPPTRRPVTAFSSPITWREKTAKPSSVMRAPWGSKALWPSGGTSPIGPDAHLTSRSRIRPRQRQGG